MFTCLAFHFKFEGVRFIKVLHGTKYTRAATATKQCSIRSGKRQYIHCRDLIDQVSIFCLPILTGTDGKLRMSKSTGNYIGLDEPPSEMYGKVMSITDELIPQYMTLILGATADEVAAAEQGLKNRSMNPMEQPRSASRMTSSRCSTAKTTRRLRKRPSSASSSAVRTPPRTPRPFSIESSTARRRPVVDAVSVSLPRLSNNARRGLDDRGAPPIDQGAVAINGEVVRGTIVDVKLGDVIRIGRHKFFRVVL